MAFPNQKTFILVALLSLVICQVAGKVNVQHEDKWAVRVSTPTATRRRTHIQVCLKLIGYSLVQTGNRHSKMSVETI